MPADGVLDMACLRGSLRISLLAGRATVVALARHPAVCVADGPQTIPFVAAQVPMPPGGVW
jgi:hypothetical protein